MARPRKEGLDYFSHDTDAVNDEKIELLKSLYKNDGYAFYFIMLERIYRNANFEIDVSDAETKEEMFQILSKKVGVELELFKQILNTCMKYNCFDKELYESKGIITSSGIKKRAEMVTGKRSKMQERYKKTKKVSDAETKEETPQTKEKKSKVNKTKDNIFLSDSNEYRLADYLRKYILKNNPSARVPNDEKIQSWCKVIDLMARVDKRTVEDIKEHIHFSQIDTFWSTNILSPTSLRKQYDQLTMKIKTTQNIKPKEIEKPSSYKIVNEDCCPTCKGKGVIKENNEWVECPKCKGGKKVG